ncbi:MAG: DUF11 domain-containing protein [Acidimicrobiia bacterium]|nr:DUF11 domain-containing protein [Acidimicrobiia bacterium]
MITTMGRGHALQQKLMAVLTALAVFVALVAVYAPMASAAIDISIPINTTVHAPVGSSTLLATVATGDLEGQVCSVSADAINQQSVHPGNDLVVASDDSSVVLENVEGASGGTVHADGTLTLSDAVTVTLIMGPDHVFSAGLTVSIDCVPTTTTTTTTTQPIQESEVSVTPGACLLDDEGQPFGPVDVTISPDSSATVTVYSDAGMEIVVFSFGGSGGSGNVSSGTYYWDAEAAEGYTLVGETSGEFTITDCSEPEVSDLGITKVDLVDPVSVDSDNPTALITYEITVTNFGPSVAENVVVTDTLPASLTYISATPEAGTCSHTAGTVTCDLGDMAVGAEVMITVVVQTESVGEVSELTPLNEVSVSSDTQDNNQDNNTDDEETNIVEVLDTEVVDPDVLPFTGADDDILLTASIVLLGMGFGLLWITKEEDDPQLG